MAKPYKSLKQSKVSFTLELSSNDIKKATNSVIQSLAQQIEVKGFRKGHAPKEMIVQRAGAGYIQQEALLKAFQKAFGTFCMENEVNPIASPSIDVKDKDKDPVKVEVEVEVYPEVTVADYAKIKPKVKAVKTEAKEVEDYIVQIMNDMGLGSPVERAAKDGDTIEVSFVGRLKKGGEELPQTKGEKTKYTIGSGYYLPDLEKAFVGMKPGEKKEGIKVAFPKEYHSKDFAGKTILFDAEVHTVIEADPSKLKKADIMKITGQEQTPTEFKKRVKEVLQSQKEQQAQKEAVNEFQDKLVDLVKADLPQSWIDQERDNRMARLENHPVYKKDKAAFLKQMKTTEEKLKKQYEADGEKTLKQFLGLKTIVEKENVELTEAEKIQVEVMTEQRLQKTGKKAKKGSSEFAQQIHQATLDMKINKFLQSLVDETKKEKKPAPKKTTKKAE